MGRSTDSYLTDAGYPLFETLDSSHSTVSVQATIDRYASEATMIGRGPVEEWSFTVETDVQPMIGSYWEGDWCDLDTGMYNDVDGTGNPYLFEGGPHRLRITGMSGDEEGRTVKITTMPVFT